MDMTALLPRPVALAFLVAAMMLGACGSPTSTTTSSTGGHTTTVVPTSTTTETITTTTAAQVVPGSDASTTTTVETTNAPSETTTTSPDSPTGPNPPSPHPVFDPILDELRERSELPIRLPSRLALPEPSDSGFVPTAVLVDVGPDRYRVDLEFGEDCNGAGVCHIGSYWAGTPSDTSLAPSNTPVPLPDGLSGYYAEPTCGANCSDGIVSWSEVGPTGTPISYGVTTALFSVAEAMDIAWSTMTDTPAPAAPQSCPESAVERDGVMADIVVDELDAGGQVVWLIACSSEGVGAHVLPTVGDVGWVSLQSTLGAENYITVSLPGGRSQLFSHWGGSMSAVIDGDFERLLVGDLVCSGGATFDASAGSKLRFYNPQSVDLEPTQIPANATPCP